MEEADEPEETQNTHGNRNKKIPLGTISAEGSEKITSSSENEVEEIPKDKEAPGYNINTLHVNSGIFERSRTFDAGCCTDQPFQVAINIRNQGTVTRSLFANRSLHSSSSQEDYEPDTSNHYHQQHFHQAAKNSTASKHHLIVSPGGATARSMECLRTTSCFSSTLRNYSEPESEEFVEDSRSLESLDSHSVGRTAGVSCRSHQYRSFLMPSRLDINRFQTCYGVKSSKSSENLHQEENLKAEVRRGLFASCDRSKLQHLSLPPPSNFISLTSPGGSDRRITILSRHSPMGLPNFGQAFASATPASCGLAQQHSLKARRKKAIVLPKLVLARSESTVFE